MPFKLHIMGPYCLDDSFQKPGSCGGREGGAMAMLCASYEVTFNQAFAPNVVRRLADVTHLAFDVLGTSLENFAHRPKWVHVPRDY
jgi:hypothetical protein